MKKVVSLILASAAIAAVSLAAAPAAQAFTIAECTVPTTCIATGPASFVVIDNQVNVQVSCASAYEVGVTELVRAVVSFKPNRVVLRKSKKGPDTMEMYCNRIP